MNSTHRFAETMIYGFGLFLNQFLLPCPFCASTELEVVDADEWWQVECSVCGGLGPVTSDIVYGLEDPIRAVTEETALDDGEDSSLWSGPIAAALLWNIRGGPIWQFEERAKELFGTKKSEQKPHQQEIPCPFCGGQEIEEEEDSVLSLLGHRCVRCGAYGPSKWDFKDLEEPVTKEALWKLWRTRLITRDRKD